MRRWFASCVSLLILTASCPMGYAAKTEQDEWARLRTIAGMVGREAMAPPLPEVAVSAAIHGYMRSIDAFSFYLSPRQVAQLRAEKTDGFAGVGMDILQDKQGRLFCLPYAASPAARAGISYGDRLQRVDSAQAEGMPLPLLESAIRGQPGSIVRLGIRSGQEAREIEIAREQVTVSAVTLFSEMPFPRIRIFRFDERTLPALEKALEQVPDDKPLILDLRGNVGGDLQEALRCAGLFVPEGTLLVTVAGKQDKKQAMRADGGRKIHRKALAVWQDGFTASAAEVFCAALAQSGKAVTLGQRSFGKGLTQRVLATPDGGLLGITAGELILPDGSRYHGKGLEPALFVTRNTNSSDTDFLRRTYEAFGLKP